MTFEELRSATAGPVLTPADPDYDEEVAGFNLAAPLRPDVVVGVTGESDVIAAVRYASANRLTVHVQATGHGAHVPESGGLLISTRRMDALSLDPVARLAVIGAGTTWAPVVAAAAEHGLAPITGSAPGVGAVGYLLGGGFGPLVRSHGVSSDYVRAFRLVTPAGEAITVSPAEHPDLFWALRGGKGGFGVVTEVTVELAELPQLYAGSLAFEGAAIEPALRAWLDFTRTADDRVSTSVALIGFPPLDFIPEPFRGKHILSLRFAFPGGPEEGERLAAPLRAAAPVLLDQLGPMPIAEVGRIYNDPTEPSPAWSRGTLLTAGAASTGFADAVLAAAGPGGDFMVCEVRQLGSRAATDVPGGSAVGGRSGQYAFFLVGPPDPSRFAALPAAADRALAAVAPWINDETNITWAGGPESPDFGKAWAPAATERLTELRREGDPLGIFAYGP